MACLEFVRFLDELHRLGVGFQSLKEGLDTATDGGRRVATWLASVAGYEAEALSAPVVAGQERARAAGKRWGGWPKGRRRKVTPEQVEAVQRMLGEGVGVSAMARATGLTRKTVYRVLAGFGFKPRRRPGAAQA
jgi:DNA invertase Pin-like site-specific DNA recombinase